MCHYVIIRFLSCNALTQIVTSDVTQIASMTTSAHFASLLGTEALKTAEVNRTYSKGHLQLR